MAGISQQPVKAGMPLSESLVGPAHEGSWVDWQTAALRGQRECDR